MELFKKLRFLNGNVLKVLAAVFMLVDHMGMLLFPDEEWLRVIGRLSMPLFAFMIAEGCRYTKNKYKHFALLFGLGVACQIVYIIFDPKDLYLGILITFSISTLIIYAMQYAKKCFFLGAKWMEKITSVFLVAILISLSYFLCELVLVDYGFWGIMMPVFASIFDFHRIPAPIKEDERETSSALTILKKLKFQVIPQRIFVFKLNTITCCREDARLNRKLKNDRLCCS